MSSNSLKVPILFFYFILLFAFDFKSCVDASTLEGSYEQEKEKITKDFQSF